MSVLVAHPGRQHSHQLVAALKECSMLEHYYCGIPISRNRCPWYLLPFQNRFRNGFIADLESVSTCIPVSTCIRNVVPRLVSPSSCVSICSQGDRWFDRAVARRLVKHKCSVVVAYENAALETFAAAKKLGMTTVLDAASVHHSQQDLVLPFKETPDVHKQITDNKDREIELADYILTTSELARQSYVSAGASPDKVLAIPMGVDFEHFGKSNAANNTNETLQFIFVGRFAPLKGSQSMQEAMEMASRAKLPINLTIVGDMESHDILKYSNVRFIKRQPHSRLPETLSQHDVLILPSRFDSFGMVVVEAMAVGLPVIVSPGVGSKMVVEPYRNGLVMQGFGSDSLLNAMKWFLENRDCISEMRVAAKHTASQFTWPHYHQRTTQVLQDIVDGRRSSQAIAMEVS